MAKAGNTAILTGTDLAAGINQLYDPDRILYPMKRVGKRGEGRWKRITWEEALTELTARNAKRPPLRLSPAATSPTLAYGPRIEH